MVFTYRSNAETAAALTDEIAAAGGRARAVQLDLADTAATAAAVEAAAGGGLHTVVYASGPYVTMEYVARIDPEWFWRQCTQDILAFYNLVHASLPHLRSARGALSGRHHVRHTALPEAGLLSSVPKGAVEALVRALAQEEGRYGVRANCVGPGMMAMAWPRRSFPPGRSTSTPSRWPSPTSPWARFGSSSDIAEAVCFLASDSAGYITGQKLDVDGGYSV